MQAELYYYDFLNNKSDETIPKDIIKHIEQCPHCREKINQLDIELSSYHTKKSENNHISGVITNLLKLHMAYIGNKVDCKIVKPFLPVILDPDLGIRIPTPINVITAYREAVEREASPLMPCPEVQPRESRVPKPTRKPPRASLHHCTDVI